MRTSLRACVNGVRAPTSNGASPPIGRREVLRKNLVQIPETRCHLRIGRLLEGVAEGLRRGLCAIRALDGRNRARLRGLQLLSQKAVVRGLARWIEVVLARVVEQTLL